MGRGGSCGHSQHGPRPRNRPGAMAPSGAGPPMYWVAGSFFYSRLPPSEPIAFCETKDAGGGNHARMFELAHDGDIARLTLSRSEARNAIPAAGWGRLEEALGAA